MNWGSQIPLCVPTVQVYINFCIIIIDIFENEVSYVLIMYTASLLTFSQKKGDNKTVATIIFMKRTNHGDNVLKRTR